MPVSTKWSPLSIWKSLFGKYSSKASSFTRSRVSFHTPFSFTDPFTLNSLPPHLPSFMLIVKSSFFSMFMSKFTFGESVTEKGGTVCPSLKMPLSLMSEPLFISSMRCPSTVISSMVGYISMMPSFLFSVSNITLPFLTPSSLMFTEST